MLKFESILVVTAGRTGSQLIKHNLQRYYKCAVEHTHNPLVEPRTNQLVIISKRLNDFNSIVSTIIGRRTNEFVTYTSKEIEPFAVSKEEFESTFWFVLCHQTVTHQRFPSAIVVHFEPLIANHQYLFSLFGVDSHTNFDVPKKSPYSAQHLIRNYEECKLWFDQLSQQSVDQTLLDTFIQTIKVDLSTIKKNL